MASTRNALGPRAVNDTRGQQPPKAAADARPSAKRPADTAVPLFCPRDARALVHIDRVIGASTLSIQECMVQTESLDKVAALPPRYLEQRRSLIDMICTAVTQLELEPSTGHVAVGYLDKVAAAFVDTDEWRAVPATCLMLAVKWEEKTCETDYEKLPDVKLLADIVLRWHNVPEYPRDKFEEERERVAKRIHPLEIQVVAVLDWRMNIVTPLHYLGLYQRKGLLFSNDSVTSRPLPQLPYENRVQVFEYLQGYLMVFADIVLQSAEFYSTHSSLLAAGMVLATRKALNVLPLWNPALEAVLGVDRRSSLTVQTAVWRLYKDEYPERAANSESKEREAIEYFRANGLEVPGEDQEAAEAAAAVAAGGQGVDDAMEVAGPMRSPSRVGDVHTALSSPGGSGGRGGATVLITAATPSTESSPFTVTSGSSLSSGTGVTPAMANLSDLGLSGMFTGSGVGSSGPVQTLSFSGLHTGVQLQPGAHGAHGREGAIYSGASHAHGGPGGVAWPAVDSELTRAVLGRQSGEAYPHRHVRQRVDESS